MGISVITVNYNDKEGLERTIRSVREQTYSDIEFLIIDGGSTDGSVDVIKQNLDIITKWVSEKDDGIYDAMNKGVQKATKKYLNFMNAGDCFADKDVLEHIFSSSPNDDVLYGDVITCKGETPTGTMTFPQKLTARQMFNGGITHQALFTKRKFHLENPYSLTMPIIADWDFLIRRMFENATFRHVNKTVCYFDVTGISGSRPKKSHDEHTKQFIQILDELVPPYIKEDIQELNRYKNPNNIQIIKHFQKQGLRGKMIATIIKFLQKIPLGR